jgi:hypothetical protein
MSAELTVGSPWVFIRDGCSMRHNVLDQDEVEFIIKGSGRTVEWAFTATGLRQFLRIGAVALQEMQETTPRTFE